MEQQLQTIEDRSMMEFDGKRVPSGVVNYDL